MISFLTNHPILLFICIMIVIVGVWFLASTILDKTMNRSVEKKYQREFGLMCYAVASVVSSKTKCDIVELMRQIDENIEYCTKFKDKECDERIRRYYHDKNYVSFTYLAAQMRFEYKGDIEYYKEDYEALSQFCGLNDNLSALDRNRSYDNNSLRLHPEGSGYLFAAPLLMAIWAVVYFIISIYRIFL